MSPRDLIGSKGGRPLFNRQSVSQIANRDRLAPSTQPQPFKVIDLCAGIGGIRRGFERGMAARTVLSAEIDDYACKTYEHLFGDNPKNDLTTKEFKTLAEQTEYDILLAGFPCQTFSPVGKREGFMNEEKGQIFLLTLLDAPVRQDFFGKC